METRSIPPRSDVTLAPTAPRVTPTSPRASRFGEVFSSTVVRSAESAVKALPGSPMMAVAIRGATGATTAMGVPINGVAGAQATLPGATLKGPEGPLTSAAGSTPTTGAPLTGGEAGSVEGSLQQSQDMNLYYLKIQEDVNAQNRQFTVLSNVMKAEHDTVKTAIGNIR